MLLGAFMAIWVTPIAPNTFGKFCFLLKLVHYFVTFIRLLTKMSLILVEHLITEDSLTLNVPDML